MITEIGDFDTPIHPPLSLKASIHTLSSCEYLPSISSLRGNNLEHIIHTPSPRKQTPVNIHTAKLKLMKRSKHILEIIQMDKASP
jgi:hypothetical protein